MGLITPRQLHCAFNYAELKILRGQYSGDPIYRPKVERMCVRREIREIRAHGEIRVRIRVKYRKNVNAKTRMAQATSQAGRQAVRTYVRDPGIANGGTTIRPIKAIFHFARTRNPPFVTSATIK